MLSEELVTQSSHHINVDVHGRYCRLINEAERVAKSELRAKLHRPASSATSTIVGGGGSTDRAIGSLGGSGAASAASRAFGSGGVPLLVLIGVVAAAAIGAIAALAAAVSHDARAAAAETTRRRASDGGIDTNRAGNSTSAPSITRPLLQAPPPLVSTAAT